MSNPTHLIAGFHGVSSITDWAERQGYRVKFMHKPTGHIVEFPAVISDFTDNHVPVMDSRYGGNQHDPITTQTGTGRNISFTMSVVNSSIEEARYNTQCTNLLIQMLYPSLDTQNTFVGKPIISIQLMNLLDGNDTGDGVDCIIENIEYSVDFDEGIINGNRGVLSLNASGKEIYPTSVKINISGRTVLQTVGDNGEANPLSNNNIYGG
jgi:hypothetical protein